MATNSELISQVRNQLKAVNADTRLTSKFIYSIINKHARWLIKRESDKLKLMRLDYLFQTLKCVKVIEAPAIDECCGVKSKCVVYRTEEKLPKLFEDTTGVIVKAVFSIDGTYEWQPIRVQEYMRKVENPITAKYDKSRYFYYNNGYLYFPKTPVKMVMIKGYFEDDIRKYNHCDPDCEKFKCISKSEQEYRIPDYLLGELMDTVLKDILNFNGRMQQDERIDKNENRKN